MFCKFCGTQLSDEARFCQGCGQEVNTGQRHETMIKQHERYANSNPMGGERKKSTAQRSLLPMVLGGTSIFLSLVVTTILLFALNQVNSDGTILINNKSFLFPLALSFISSIAGIVLAGIKASKARKQGGSSKGFIAAMIISIVAAVLSLFIFLLILYFGASINQRPAARLSPSMPVSHHIEDD